VKLQEWQLDFERMLALVRPIAASHLGQVVERGQRSGVDRDPAEWCLESLCLGCRQAVERDTVRGTEQHDTADAARARASEQRIGLRRHRAAIFVAGVRGDQQLGRARSVVSSTGADQIVDDLRAQRAGRGGVEQTVDDGFAYGRHAHDSCH
jgi:hypothetical protein